MRFEGVQLLTFCLVIAVAQARAPSKIINGDDAVQSEFPYQVSLQAKNKGHFCGGCILDSTHILTAAHCLLNNDGTVGDINKLSVVTGTIDTRERRADNVFRASKMTLHEKWNTTTKWSNDIAVLKLTKPIPFNSNQSPIRLPSRDTPAGAVGTATGWGATEVSEKTNTLATSKAAVKLQKLQTTVVSTEVCKRRWESDMISGQICVLADKNAGACFYDSGSPLAYNGEVVGVTSFTIPCALGYPDVYTRVYQYVPWIKEQMRD